MFIIRYRNVFFGITGLLVLASIASVALFGLNIGPDFTGGTLAEAHYAGSVPSAAQLSASLEQAGVSGATLRAVEGGYILRAGPLSQDARAALPGALSVDGAYSPTIDRVTEVGPTVGVELRNKAFIALALVLLAIVCFIAFAFRKVSEPVSSWIYGLIAILTLLHDVIVPVGVFALFGYLWGAQVDTLFLTAILTVLGYSVHDTIVVFDRVRENLRKNKESNRKEDFEITAGASVRQTFARSVNTSVTTLLSLVALYLLGPASTEDFALVLIVGIAIGTYSSICLATPLLVTIERWKRA